MCTQEQYDQLFRQFLDRKRTLEWTFEDEMPEIYIDFPNDRSKSGRYYVESVCQDHVPAPLYFVVTGADEENDEVLDVSLPQLSIDALETIYNHLMKTNVIKP